MFIRVVCSISRNRKTIHFVFYSNFFGTVFQTENFLLIVFRLINIVLFISDIFARSVSITCRFLRRPFSAVSPSVCSWKERPTLGSRVIRCRSEKRRERERESLVSIPSSPPDPLIELKFFDWERRRRRRADFTRSVNGNSWLTFFSFLSFLRLLTSREGNRSPPWLGSLAFRAKVLLAGQEPETIGYVRARRLFSSALSEFVSRRVSRKKKEKEEKGGPFDDPPV